MCPALFCVLLCVVQRELFLLSLLVCSCAPFSAPSPRKAGFRFRCVALRSAVHISSPRVFPRVSDSLYNMYGWFLPSPSVYRHAARGFPFPISAFFLGVGRHGVGEPLVRRCRATPRSVESESSVRSVCGLSDGTSPCLGMPGHLHRTTCASND